MPAIGARQQVKNEFLITTKIYGPDGKLNVVPQEVKDAVEKFIQSSERPENKDLANAVSLHIAEKWKNTEATWVTCEVITVNSEYYENTAMIGTHTSG